MTDSLTIKIEGWDVIEQNLKAMRKEVKEKHVRLAANKGANAMRDAIILEAERKFSRGRRKGGLTNVRVRKTKSGGPGARVLNLGVGNEAREVYMKWPEAAHWHLLEFGTRPRIQKTTGRRTGRGPPRPFIRPAYEKNKRRAVDLMLDELAKPARKPRKKGPRP